MSELADAFSTLGGSIFDTVAEVTPLDASSLADLTGAADESAGLDLTAPFADTVTQAPEAVTDAASSTAAAPAAPPAQAPSPPPAMAASQPVTASAEPGAFDQDASKGMFDSQGAPMTGKFKSLSWFQSLSPGAQAILAGGVAGGAGALMSALSQRHMIEYQKERDEQQHTWDVDKEQRARDDYARRHHVMATPDGAFKPKGIIDAHREA